jgi:uncharacterized protein (DUF2147 family)
MKKLYILAALLMATTSAHAGGNEISFEIQGQRIYIEQSRNCDSLSCLKISAPGLSNSNFGNFGSKSKSYDDDNYADNRYDAPASKSANSGYGGYKGSKSKNYNDDNYGDNRDAPSSKSNDYGSKPKRYNDDNYGDDRYDSKASSSSNSNYGGYKGSRPKRYNNYNDTADNRNDTQPSNPAPAQAAAPQPAATNAAADPAPAQTTVASNGPAYNAAPQAPAAAAPASDPTSPLGVWATEEGKGNVRIEECGSNLCGYAVKTGEKILISMRPSGSKWSGQIHDPDSGRNYDSTIAMKGTNSLKVQGCAFGGMFCGGQTWKRVS